MTTEQQQADIILIDLSSVAYPIWHTCQGDPNPNACSDQVVERVRKLAGSHKHVAICADAGPSFRKDINAGYKANRPEKNAVLVDQIRRAIETLKIDGFPVWSQRGMEADDIIATATKQARAADLTVLICTGDKDLAQLVSDHVTLQKVSDGSRLDTAAVGVKFGVTPEQMRDFLTLCGDSSDNVQGAKGIGGKYAADLLGKYGSLDKLYEQLEKRGPAALGIKPGIATSLKEFKDSGTFAITRQLITMKDDVEIPFEELAAERTPQEGSRDADTGDVFAGEEDAVDPDDHAPEIDFESPAPPPAGQTAEFEAPEPKAAPPKPIPTAVEPVKPTAAPAPKPAPVPTTALARRESTDIVEAEIVYERKLEPRNLKEAQFLALDMFKSNMFTGYGNKEAVLSAIMVGRELGLPAMASLRAIHVIDGKHSLSADAMVALVLKSGMAEYFKPVAWDEKGATWETKRRDGAMGSDPIKFTYTVEMAKMAGLVKENKAGNWTQRPTEMCLARAKAILARMCYGDLLAGLYTPEELREIAEAA